MIHWLWLIAAFVLGGSAGMLAVCLSAASGYAEHTDECARLHVALGRLCQQVDQNVPWPYWSADMCQAMNAARDALER